MKKISRYLLFALLFIAILCSLVACNDTETTDGNTAGDGNGGESTDIGNVDEENDGQNGTGNDGSQTTVPNENQNDNNQNDNEGSILEPSLLAIYAKYNGSLTVNQSINHSLLTVIGSYSNGEDMTITDYTLSQETFATAGRKCVTVTVDDTDKSVDFYVKVNKVSNEKTVYFTNVENWTQVYAYVWNSSNNSVKATWPGEKCTYVETNGYGQKIYSYLVSAELYDRIIFNNGNGVQTEDLFVNNATDAYYYENGVSGVYTYGATDYGTIKKVTLYDQVNMCDGKKTVYVYTPSGYNANDKSKKYGVLYMFDGQNLFANSNDEYSCSEKYPWGTDVAVNNMKKNGIDGIIIVGIDNSESSERRDSELTMSTDFGQLTHLGDSKYGNFTNGTLDKMGNFIKDTLMPYMAENYNISSLRETTGIAGSSSGGLGAFYLGLRDSDLYGYVGAFSPATGLFYKSSWNKFLSNLDLANVNQKMYIYCGKNSSDDLENTLYNDESNASVASTDKLKDLLVSNGYNASDIKETYTNKAIHSERCWRHAFSDFISWIG